jgi:hypothetical protein
LHDKRSLFGRILEVVGRNIGVAVSEVVFETLSEVGGALPSRDLEGVAPPGLHLR